jgi:hypothetical protein
MSLSALCFQPPRRDRLPREQQLAAKLRRTRSLQNFSCAVCNRSAMGRVRRLQYKVLKCRGKRRGGKSNARAMEKQCKSNARAMEAMGECQ